MSELLPETSYKIDPKMGEIFVLKYRDVLRDLQKKIEGNKIAEDVVSSMMGVNEELVNVWRLINQARTEHDGARESALTKEVLHWNSVGSELVDELKKCVPSNVFKMWYERTENFSNQIFPINPLNN